MKCGLARKVVLMLVVAVAGFSFAQDQKAAAHSEQEPLNPIDCTGTAKACTKPAKFLTKTFGCICFTCGYGTPESRQICTKSPSEAKAFANLVEKSGYADESMDAAVGTESSQKFASAQSTPADTAAANAGTPAAAPAKAKPKKKAQVQ